jgi:HEAT repeat protein
MRCRHRIVAIVAACVIAFVLIAQLIPTHEEGPIVWNRPLYHWLEDLSSRHPPTAARAAEAVRELGTNGLPYLLALRFAEASRAELLLAQTLSLYYPEHQSTLDRRRFAATRGLFVLGPEAAVWVSRAFDRDEPIVRATLTPSTQDRHPVNRAAEVLIGLGNNSLPVLHSLLASSKPNVRFHAAYALWSQPSQIQVATETSVSLVRSILPLLRDPVPENRAMAILALTCLDAGTETLQVANAVGELLADPHSGVRSCAAVFLSTFPKETAHLAGKVAEALERERNSPRSDTPTRERYVRTRSKAEVVRQFERTLRALNRTNLAMNADADANLPRAR